MDISLGRFFMRAQACETNCDPVIKEFAKKPPSEVLISLANASLDPAYTDLFFIQFEHLFVDICARWIDRSDENVLDISKSTPYQIVAALGRTVPFAPCLSKYAFEYLGWFRTFVGSIGLSEMLSESHAHGVGREQQHIELLLGLFRLIISDATFGRVIELACLEESLESSSPIVRYLAVRLLCRTIHAADAATEKAIQQYVRDGNLSGTWEGRPIDYAFLSLWEERRHQDMMRDLNEARAARRLPLPNHIPRQVISPKHFSQHVKMIGNVLLPVSSDFELDPLRDKKWPSLHRIKQESDTTATDHSGPPPLLIPTRTTVQNLERMARGILSCKHLLLTGPSGSGKSTLVSHFARELDVSDSMLTLHLNSQSDAKSLIGSYISGNAPGTFEWQPGVLTTAVQQGHWVCIEDIDRAPNEILSLLLPLIESDELRIPGRDEIIGASGDFKLIGTIRLPSDSQVPDESWKQRMLGVRFWQEISISPLPAREMGRIISSLWPSLGPHTHMLLAVYKSLQGVSRSNDLRQANSRPINLSVLEKWCERIHVLTDGAADFSETDLDKVFLDAIDCFAGHLPSSVIGAKIAPAVSRELGIDPARRNHLLKLRTIHLDLDEPDGLRVGRVEMERVVNSPPRAMLFAPNTHTVRLVEKLAAAVKHREPVLLVGETGIGKTHSIQYLANRLGCELFTFNLSQQSQSEDLIGGLKPMSIKARMIPLQDQFRQLFHETFSNQRNQEFVQSLNKAMKRSMWKRVVQIWKGAIADVHKRKSQEPVEVPELERPAKRQRTSSLETPAVESGTKIPYDRWNLFESAVENVESLLADGAPPVVFWFQAGKLVEAVRQGYWVLLDEINLAPSATLEILADLLPNGPRAVPFLTFTEPGQVERVQAHPNFRLFAAMNPSTDVGKSDLPMGIRSRFTEFYVESPDGDIASIRSIAKCYLPDVVPSMIDKVTELYAQIQSLARKNHLADVVNKQPHFSLRNLTRALIYASDIASSCSTKRGLYEGFCMTFVTMLNYSSALTVETMIKKSIFGDVARANVETCRRLDRPRNDDGRDYINVGKFWFEGYSTRLFQDPKYIITFSVQRNLDNLARAVSAKKYPILLQGPTSAGKTSLIRYLAQRTGNTFVRINNHEHTDLQEYIGSYISTPEGNLEFREGVLVNALRNGHWIVLDELNLAPTEVLEALNRLLDENRELWVPEIEDVVRPHKDFMLFATQNPAGLYSGRKELSRAFRNRFLELHFNELPTEELEEILTRQSRVPPSWCRKIVKVYSKLSEQRQTNRLFELHSFATLRDLFKWVRRLEAFNAISKEDLALHGFMLLGERVRTQEEKMKVKNIIEAWVSDKPESPSVQIDDSYPSTLEVTPNSSVSGSVLPLSGELVMTPAMKRLFILVEHALRSNEPVLLVGETGTGKTSVCQAVATAFGKELHILNAHQNTETSDIIGSQRPTKSHSKLEQQLHRDILSALELKAEESSSSLETLLSEYDIAIQKGNHGIPSKLRQSITAQRAQLRQLFKWKDGLLVQAMKKGDHFLLDEISLADDAVLERLNSVLEDSRSLNLAEKGPNENVVAKDGFQFLATMNPGGDYGKKELSPALRNRFTEIWVPPIEDAQDILDIVLTQLRPDARVKGHVLVNFAKWFQQTCRDSATSISIRDIKAWIEFVNSMNHLNYKEALFQGAMMVYVDTLGVRSTLATPKTADQIRLQQILCRAKLGNLLGEDVSKYDLSNVVLQENENHLRMAMYKLSLKPFSSPNSSGFSFDTPRTRSNLLQLFRALQVDKPILIEGHPGVGKTSLVTALANKLGHKIRRINLSEQTDLLDLFGWDIPVKGDNLGNFEWRAAPFLTAMLTGEWVLLDEMNLASQSVLEGLNPCLDHRHEVTIPELGETFKRHPRFRVFATQNPHHSGGDRKGLPASFINRFTLIYADAYTPEDQLQICKKEYPSLPEGDIVPVIGLLNLLNTASTTSSIGSLNPSWEFNLRDAQRWLQLATNPYGLLPYATPYDLCDIVVRQRFRDISGQLRVDKAYREVFNSPPSNRSFFHDLTAENYVVGLASMPRDPYTTRVTPNIHMAVSHLNIFESMILAVQQNSPILLVGDSGAGKSSLIQSLAAVRGACLIDFPLSADIDASDLVGSFEQIDPQRPLEVFFQKFWRVADELMSRALSERKSYVPKLFADLLGVRQAPGPKKRLVAAVKALKAATKSPVVTSEVSTLLHTARSLVRGGQNTLKPRFEWTDSVLVQALEAGDWIVLDNANLCKPAVLDRLNSLLEPNGQLIINEQPLKNGMVRSIRPHKNFRLFLTMDPKHGELSKAMHNRVVELHVKMPNIPTLCTPFWLESKVYRFRNFMKDFTDVTVGCKEFGIAVTDHLAPLDANIISRFKSQIPAGILPRGTDEKETLTTISCIQHISDQIQRLNMSGPNDGWRGLSIHPLNDEIPLRAGSTCTLDPLGFASLYEISLQVLMMDHEFESVIRDANTEQLSNALTRSIVAARKPNVVGESGHLARFLRTFLGAMKSSVESFIMGEDLQQEVLEFLERAVAFWWNVFHLAAGQFFDDAMKQAVIGLGREKLKAQNDNNRPSGPSALRQYLLLIDEFSSPIRLSTGQAMEQLWHHFRPKTAPSIARLNMFLQLENLTDRFDKVSFSKRVSVNDLCSVRASFGKTMSLVLGTDIDATKLILDLRANLESMEAETEGILQEYFFKEQFRLLLSVLNVRHLAGLDHDNMTVLRQVSALLAKRPTKWDYQIFTESRADAKSLLVRLAYSTTEAESDFLNPAHVLRSINRQLYEVPELPLYALRSFREEASFLGKTMSLGAPSLSEDLTTCMINILQSMWENMKAGVPLDLTSYEGREVLSQLIHSIDYGIDSATLNQYTDKEQIASQAWISFGLLLILLYVPNHAFDPATKQALARTNWGFEKGDLEAKLNGLLAFENVFSGQSTTLRIRQVESKLRTLGNEPAVNAICRPENSQLPDLQAEFDNVLRAVQPLLTTDESADLDVTRANIHKVVQRLRDNFRAYDDLTIPLIGFLQCLVIGFEFRDAAKRKLSVNDKNLLVRLRSYRDLEIPDTHTSALDLEVLAELAIARSIDSSISANSNFQNCTSSIFSRLYETWRDRVTKEQKRNVKKSSFYVYRGAQEDEETVDNEEFEAMFPTSDIGPASKDSADQGSLSREMAIRIADIHSSIYYKTLDSAAYILHALCHARSPLSTTETAVEMLPSLLLRVQHCIRSVSELSGATGMYNFYKDSNVEQARKLITIVQNATGKFLGFQKHWPEHDTIAEVIRICNEIEASSHSEPIVKFLIKSEKLHETIHEWQRVASREFSSADIFDDLTKLIISWRRLELNTWLRLFDIEVEQSSGDAKSWWFVAYENIIVVPNSLLSSQQSLDAHTEELLRTLQGFMESTSLGQYNERLTLLKQFLVQLQQRVKQQPQLEIVHSSVSNFVRFYEWFSVPVKEAILKGRQGLEREVKEVVQLASWKDTTIEALRQSAKASHRKLFKLVRKLRQLLQTPVTSIVSSGIPESVIETPQSSSLSSFPTRLSTGTETYSLALQLCARGVNDWERIPSRFKSIASTTTLMQKLCEASTVTSGYLSIHDFLSNLKDSMARLQKETPSSLKGDNKDIVKHLKLQKRRLFAETLRELRQMGIQYNLSNMHLSKQSDLSKVLTRTATLPGIDTNVTLQSAEYNFQRTLDLMPQVRQVLREHSGDLTPAEVTRSVGYLEGLLYRQLEQRQGLSKLLLEQFNLSAALNVFYETLTCGEQGLQTEPPETFNDLESSRRMVLWLQPVLKVFARVLEAQAEMGGLKASAVLDELQQQIDKLAKLALKFRNLPALQQPLVCMLHTDLRDQCESAFKALHEDVGIWCQRIPEFGPVLSEMKSWMYPPKEYGGSVAVSADVHSNLESFQKTLFSAIDFILASIQDVNGVQPSPSSPKDETAWLVKDEARSTSILRSYNIASTAESVKTILQLLAAIHCDDLNTSTALCAVVAPIFNQYQAFVDNALNNYSLLHAATCRLSYHLAKAFVHLGKEGFCTPPETSNEKGEESEKLEGGTGLGDGEGAEDISKDIREDEDLTELAEGSRNAERQEEIEDEQDAVDMADAELEGQMGDIPDRDEQKDDDAKSELSADDQDDMDEEVGDVDDLGPGTVDEKLWDDGGEAEKDKETDKSKGTRQDEKIAAQLNEKTEEDGEVGEEEVPAEESEEINQQSLENMDPHIQETENLDLPDDMQLEGKREDESNDENLDEMDEFDDNDAMEAGHDLENDEQDMNSDANSEEMPPVDGEEDIRSDREDEASASVEAEQQDADDTSEVPHEDVMDAVAEDETAAEEALTMNKSGGLTAAESHEGQDNDDLTTAQREQSDGDRPEGSSTNTADKAGSGANGSADAVGRDDDLQDTAKAEALMKLGDTLERWYNQQRQIRAARDRNTQPRDEELRDADFEHLPDDDTPADAQALGAAKQDQAIALDTENAIDVNNEEMSESLLPNGDQDDNINTEDAEMTDTELPDVSERQPTVDGTSRTFVGDQRSTQVQNRYDNDQYAESESDIDEVDERLSTVNIQDSAPSDESRAAARVLWNKHASAMQPFAAMLTEQLRLILAPTLATRLRGDYRTGKRLNMKRIIPYIASGYKKDKIWMRRTVPTKRSYQLMIALDDSKSMAEGGSKELAFETLCLISKALATLEAGELCVVGFGDTVRVHHPFERPFSDEAGVGVFAGFAFDQRRTDVRALLHAAIELFQDARRRASGAAAELWQLMLVISDGVCEDHDGVARLVRNAQELRIMIVFVVVDAAANGASAGGEKEQSIMELQTAEFTQDDNGQLQLVRKRYMDTFPFRWWLVVRDVRELSSVLATALRQWFAEVADASG